MPALLLRAGAAYAAAMRAALEEAGYGDIPRNGAYVVGGLRNRGGAPLSSFIDGLKLSKQVAGQLMDSLVAGGYIERQVDDADRRRLTIHLTERGQAAARVLAAARRAMDAKLLAITSAADVARTRRTLFALGEMDRS